MAMQEAPALAKEWVMALPIPLEAPQMKMFLPRRLALQLSIASYVSLCTCLV